MSDFYVGYQPNAPSSLARWIRRLVFAVLLVGVVGAAAAALLQNRFAASRFEFGVVKEFTGDVQSKPYPILHASQPDDRSYLLVAPGKHGADVWFADLDGQEVSLRGSLIYYLDKLMVEVQADSIEVATNAAGRAPEDPVVDLGEHTLRGEIVGSKCFLGVMKPGRMKPHRACAALCISGGIPPMLLVEIITGEQSLLLLVDADGNAVNRRVLRYVAEPVEITGSVRRQGEQLIFYANLDSLRRL